MPRNQERATTEPTTDDAGEAQVAAAVAAEEEQGYRGVRVDPTPNRAYTVAGVTAPEPTPETDPALAAEVATAPNRAGAERLEDDAR